MKELQYFLKMSLKCTKYSSFKYSGYSNLLGSNDSSWMSLWIFFVVVVLGQLIIRTKWGLLLPIGKEAGHFIPPSISSSRPPHQMSHLTWNGLSHVSRNLGMADGCGHRIPHTYGYQPGKHMGSFQILTSPWSFREGNSLITWGLGFPDFRFWGLFVSIVATRKL